jgi:hypothetical protein
LVRNVSVQKVHWKVLSGCLREFWEGAPAATGAETGRLLLRRLPRGREPREPRELRDPNEKADANEPPLLCDVPRLLADEPWPSDLPEPSSVYGRL